MNTIAEKCATLNRPQLPKLKVRNTKVIFKMSTYYCYKCARDLRLIIPVDPDSITKNSYQLEKYVKHTAPTGVYYKNGVFHDGDLNTYQDYMVTTAASGCLEVDDRGRKNLIYYAGEETGLEFRLGEFHARCSGVKVVLSEDHLKLHGYPVNFQPRSLRCFQCGDFVPFDPHDM